MLDIRRVPLPVIARFNVWGALVAPGFYGPNVRLVGLRVPTAAVIFATNALLSSSVACSGFMVGKSVEMVDTAT
jgi:hypothetical protein